MPPRGTRKLGNFGESAAAAYLTRQGYTLVTRQWRCTHGEIDLVARQGSELVFIEVRTRRGHTHGNPEESITPRKQTRLVTLAYSYLEAHALPPEGAWRIDVIALTLDGSGRVQRLHHIVHAVEGS